LNIEYFRIFNPGFRQQNEPNRYFGEKIYTEKLEKEMEEM
jgi:hypothetical protein